MALINTLTFIWNHPMNASGRFAALGRFATWQVASRVFPHLVALPFVDETRLFAGRGMTGVTGNWYCGLHEFAEMAFALHFLRNTDSFVDVGANLGSYSVLAAGAVGARTIAVEPDPKTFARLQMNIRLNDLGRLVHCWQGGLSSAAGVLRFTTGLDTVNHVLAAGEDAPSADVPVKTLDELIGDEVPALIKIDVEGHEKSVITGGAAVMRDSRLKAVIMEVNGSGLRYGIEDRDLVTSMSELGFEAYQYNPERRQLRSGRGRLGNVVFVRDHEEVERRLSGAKKFRLVNGFI